jgi:hypothetical protein
MTSEWTDYRENRGPRPLPVRVYAFIPGSCVQGFNAAFKSYAIVCQELALYANLMDPGDGTLSPVLEGARADLAAKGPIRIGGVFIEGRSVVLSWDRRSHIESP